MKKILTLISLFLITVEYSYSATIKVPLQYNTIQDAINAAQNGDSILVADGIYYEEINFNGYAADSVLIKSESGPDNCIIDCENQSMSIGFLFNSSDCKSTIEGFTIRNATMGIWAYANSKPIIKNNIIENCEVGVNCGSNAEPIVNSNIIRNCNNGFSGQGGGISISWSSAVVSNNLIINNSASKGGGIYCYYSTPLIINNTIIGNSGIDLDDIGGGIYIKNASPNIVNNIIAFSYGPGIMAIGNTSFPEIIYNDLFENDWGGYFFGETDESTDEFTLTGVDGNIAGDPKFSEDNFSLSFGSPCVDAGTPDTTGLNIGETDFLGLPRIYDGDGNGTAVIDIGAIELQINSGDNIETVSICQGEEYAGHSVSGIFQRTLPSSTGTDSIVVTYLTVNRTYNLEEDVIICEGEDYFGLTVAGQYTRELKTMNNCDSIIVTNLSVRPIGNCYLTLKVPSNYQTIQAAMDAAYPGDTVLVADGTYTGEGNLDLNFRGKAIVVKSENGPENCIIDCGEGTEFQAFLITRNGETRASIVEGLKIINGRWGINIKNSSPTIKNNILESNNRGIHCEGSLSNPLIENNVISKSNEEGIYCERSAGIIKNNTIKKSVYSSNFGSSGMSGIYCNMASPTIQGNDIEWYFYGIYSRNGSSPQIEGNTIKYSYSYGICCIGSSPQILENQIIENESTGIYCKNSSPQISQNLIRNNGGSSFSNFGRGTYDNFNRPFEQFVGGVQYGGISINNRSNPNIQNNIIAENKGVNVGAIFCDESSVPTILNNHIIDNSSIYGGSLIIKNNSAKIINNIITGARSTDSNLGLSRWYKDDLFARNIYEGATLKNVTYYFGFINYGRPGNVEITGCQGFHQAVWAETGERFWVEASSGVFYGDWGGLNVTVSLESNSFTIVAKRTVDYIDHGCKLVYSPEITSYGIEAEGLNEVGIVVDNQDNVPEIAYNNVFGNPGGNYIFSDSVETKSAQVFDLTGTEGNISSDPAIDPETHELLSGSPCIDAGTPDIAGLGLGNTDYAGNPRIIDGDGDGIAIIDIGAFEFQGSSFYIEENVAICQGESYEGWTESGDYLRTLIAANGKDSVVTTHLTVYPAFKPGFTVAGDTLISDSPYTSYQWCDSSGEIAGENGRQCIIKESGEYYLLATNEHDCTYASDTLYVEISTVNIVNASETGYAVIPNPNNGSFLFRITSIPPERLTLQLINSFGQVIETRLIDKPAASQSVHFDGYDLNKGVYHLVVITENEIMSHKIIIY